MSVKERVKLWDSIDTVITSLEEYDELLSKNDELIEEIKWLNEYIGELQDDLSKYPIMLIDKKIEDVKEREGYTIKKSELKAVMNILEELKEELRG